MIPLFTQLLRDHLVRRLVAPKGRVFLGPPDRNFVTQLPSPGVSLNVYLADLRENRKLGTSERQRTRVLNNGTVRDDPYPAWVDAHYLVSAWDSSQNPSVAALAEQAALRDVSAALLHADPFTPGTVYAPAAAGEEAALVAAFGVADAAALDRTLAAALAPWPTEFRVPGLQYEVLPPSGFPNLSDFWTTMGQGSTWKPVVYLVASVPVPLGLGPEYPEVTTITTLTGQTHDAAARRLVFGTPEPADDTRHLWHQIGGRVLRHDGGPAAYRPVPLARVVLQAPARDPADPPVSVQDTRTDDDGRYRFVFADGPLPPDRLPPPPSRYRLVAQYRRMPGDPPDLALAADPLAVDLDPATPFAHDIVLRPA